MNRNNITDNKRKLFLIVWAKRFFGIAAGLVWIVTIVTISQSSGSFEEQAPYCMGSTMLIFGALTLLHKGLDYWSLKLQKAEN